MVYKEDLMPFVNHPTLKGKLFIPEYDYQNQKKHPCVDCFSCQMCSDDRCGVCLERKSPCSSYKSKKIRPLKQ